MKRFANYTIVGGGGPHPRLEGARTPLLIRDLGPWDEYLTVTNAAEWVVEDLLGRGKLLQDQRLFYYDSEGELAELLHDGKHFTGFAFVSQEDRP